MTSEDLLNQVLQKFERDELLDDPDLKRRIELHLSGAASDGTDADSRDFDERVLRGVKSSFEDWDVDVHITRSSCDEHLKSRRDVDKNEPETACLTFHGNSTCYELIGFPYDSLRSIGEFILKTVEEYEEADERFEGGGKLE